MGTALVNKLYGGLEVWSLRLRLKCINYTTSDNIKQMQVLQSIPMTSAKKKYKLLTFIYLNGPNIAITNFNPLPTSVVNGIGNLIPSVDKGLSRTYFVTSLEPHIVYKLTKSSICSNMCLKILQMKA
jgi:hypothetical protein